VSGGGCRLARSARDRGDWNSRANTLIFVNGARDVTIASAGDVSGIGNLGKVKFNKVSSGRKQIPKSRKLNAFHN
jgi:hypothetical protein